MLIFQLESSQWGTWISGTNTFPIAFTKNVRLAICGSYSYAGNDNKIDSISLTSFIATYAITSLPTHYIAVGF